MKISKMTSRVLLGAALVGAAATAANAQETLRSLAEERGRYIGAILNSEWFGGGWGGGLEPEFEQIHKTQFNAVVSENEMKFDATEPSQNQFSYGNGDKMVTYAQENKMRVRGHALAWHSQVPGWMNNVRGKDAVLKALKNHIDNVVTHYKGKVAEWDVVNEAINDDNNHGWRSTGSVWYEQVGGSEFIDSAFVWAHAADPDAELCYNDYAIEWGIGSGSKAGFLLQQVDHWIENKIPITCVGTQTHIEISHESTPQNVRTLAKELAKRNITLNITELDIGFPNGSANNLGASDYQKQGHLYRQFMDVFLEEPNMGEFMIWGVTDAHSWLDGSQGKTQGLIYDKQYKAKPAYDSLIASLKAHPASEVKSPYGTVASADTAAKDTVAKDTSVKDTTTTGFASAKIEALGMSLSGRMLSIVGARSAKVEVFNLQGRPVYSEQIVKGSVDLSKLSRGLYVVRIIDGTRSLERRVVIK